MGGRLETIPSLGLSSVDPFKILLEHNVQSRPFKVFKAKEEVAGAAQDATTQQRLVDKRMRMSQEKIMSFGEVTKQRVKLINNSVRNDVEREIKCTQSQLSHHHLEDRKKTVFEEAFSKVKAIYIMILNED